MLPWRAVGVLYPSLALVGVFLAGCAPRSRMCVAPADCARDFACVAGRCQLDKPNVKPAINTARRLVVRPVDLAYLRRGHAEVDRLAPVVAFGRDASVLLMRFEVSLPKNANVLEAYVVLHRSEAVDDDPEPMSMHVNRIIEAWDGRSTSWARQPRTLETRLAATVVAPGGPRLVRLNVLEIVRLWQLRDPRDHGLALVADDSSRSGSTVALRSVTGSADVEPYLELYVR